MTKTPSGSLQELLKQMVIVWVCSW